MAEPKKDTIVSANDAALKSLFELGYQMWAARLKEKHRQETYKPACPYCQDVHLIDAYVLEDVDVEVYDEEAEKQERIDESKDIDPKKRKPKPKKTVKEIRAFRKLLRCDCEGVRRNNVKMEYPPISIYFSGKTKTFKCHECRTTMSIGNESSINVIGNRLVCWSCAKRNKVFILDKMMLERAKDYGPAFYKEVERRLEDVRIRVDRELHPENYISEDDMKEKMRERMRLINGDKS